MPRRGARMPHAPTAQDRAAMLAHGARPAPARPTAADDGCGGGGGGGDDGADVAVVAAAAADDDGTVTARAHTTRPLPDGLCSCVGSRGRGEGQEEEEEEGGIAAAGAIVTLGSRGRAVGRSTEEARRAGAWRARRPTDRSGSSGRRMPRRDGASDSIGSHR